MNAGKHICVFSNNVPFADEREMKELAREKGLLCMGPDCGVANINGAALVLSQHYQPGDLSVSWELPERESSTWRLSSMRRAAA